MKFIKQKYLTIIFSIAGGIILGLTLTFALNVNATHLTAVLSSTQLLINYGALFNRELASDKQVIIIGNGSTAGFVGIGTTNPTQKLSVAGAIESTTGGFKFPDGSTMATNAHGSSTFSTSGTFTVPTGITAVWVTMTGGGGGGGGAYNGGGAGGGASSVILAQRISVTNGENIVATIGTGGAGGGSTVSGSNGNTTSFGSYISVMGGGGGAADANNGINAVGGSAGKIFNLLSAFSAYSTNGYNGTYCNFCNANGGKGGDNYFSVGGNGGVPAGNGGNGTKGSGGGGGGDNSGTNGSGGAGGAGYVLVEW